MAGRSSAQNGRTTPRKATGPKVAAPTSIDLDTLERPDDPGPFTVTHGGNSYEFVDAQELDYRELVDLMVAAGNGDIVGAMGGMIREDDQDEFWETKIPAWKLNALIKGYLAHYKIDFDPGEAGASSPSSGGSAGRSRRTSPSRVSR